MTDQPVSAEFIEKMRAISAGIDEVFNGPPLPGSKPAVAFVLLTARFGDIEEGRVNYMSNAERGSVLAMMREYLARAEPQAAPGSLDPAPVAWRMDYADGKRRYTDSAADVAMSKIAIGGATPTPLYAHAGPAPWLPIDAAPKDKTAIIIAVPDPRRTGWIIGEAYFDTETSEWWWAGTSRDDYYGGPISETNHWPPTFWTPLPVPPPDVPAATAD